MEAHSPSASLPPFTLQPKKEVQALAPYKPPLGQRRSKVRLDFNENTKGFPDLLPHGIPMEEVSIYPAYEALLQALATMVGLDVSRLTLTNGSDEALAVIPQTFLTQGDKVLLSQPSFPLIAHNIKLTGAAITFIQVQPRSFSYDCETIEATLEEARLAGTPFKMAVFASPDNPTGAIMPIAVLERLLHAHPDTLFVLDEAYQEYTGQTAASLMSKFSHLIITRTFSKAWGLAGLRLGYIMAHPQAIAYLSRVKSPYSVNGLSVWLAKQLIPHSRRILTEAQALMHAKQTLMKNLTTLFQLHIVAGHAHFFLVWLGTLETQRFVHFLRETCNVLVRDRSSDVGLAGYVRINTGTQEENAQLLQAVAEYRLRHALIFDLDDTLVDTSESFDTVVAQLMAHYAPTQAYTHTELQALRDQGGFNDDWLATQTLLERRGITIALEDIEREGTARYLKIAKTSEKLLIPTAWLATLQQRYRLMIVTGRRKAEYEAVWAETLDPFFDEVVCVDTPSGLNAKPSPDGLLYLIQKYELHHAYYIGNSVDDILTGVRAGAYGKLSYNPAQGGNALHERTLPPFEVTPIGVTKTTSAEVLYQAGATHVWDTIETLGEAFGIHASL
ncbi:MAG: aminotransferase class I/II-fold pyridoxal phosphate-dependent enzyme [Vampirovibrionales bacterium]